MTQKELIRNSFKLVYPILQIGKGIGLYVAQNVGVVQNFDKIVIITKRFLYPDIL